MTKSINSTMVIVVVMGRIHQIQSSFTLGWRLIWFYIEIRGQHGKEGDKEVRS